MEGMIMQGLVQHFRSLSQSSKNELDSLRLPRLRCYAAMKIAEEDLQVDWLSAEEISACLEAAGVCVRPRSVANALSKALGYVSSRKNGAGRVCFKLMTEGKKALGAEVKEGVSVLRFDGTAPWSDRTRLGDLLARLSGTIRICDPYLGPGTLNTVGKLPVDCPVLFLTVNVESKPSFARELKDFRSERPCVEFRRVPHTENLHDRYVLTDQELLLVGHGIKDLGGKESFVVVLDKQLAGDVVAQTQSAFERRWHHASTI
jgi:hypothetical protein